MEEDKAKVTQKKGENDILLTCWLRRNKSFLMLSTVSYFSHYSHLHNEISRGIESKRRPKSENAEEVDYRGLVATAASRLDTINIGGQREYKNHMYRYD